MEPKQFFDKISKNNLKLSHHLPAKAKAHQFIENLIYFLFPLCNGNSADTVDLPSKWKELKADFSELIMPLRLDMNEQETCELFFNKIPLVYDELLLDAKIILEFDPAAQSMEEVILFYPGFYAIMVYRLSHLLYEMNIPIIPRIFSEYAHSATGIDIHPGAKIGKSFFIDHGTGIVIGETTVIGNNVKIYQGVTLGALNVRKNEARTKRHPTIGDNVIIYSGATILGGETVIGHDSVIGGNVWLTSSVDPCSVVYHKSEIHLKQRKKTVEQINFTI